MARNEIKPAPGMVICKKCGTNLAILDISNASNKTFRQHVRNAGLVGFSRVAICSGGLEKRRLKGAAAQTAP
jgi:hypothetical protein